MVYTRLAHYSVNSLLLDVLSIPFAKKKKGRGSVFYLVSTCKFHHQQNTYSALSYQRNLFKMLATTSYVSSVKCCWSLMLLQSNGLPQKGTGMLDVIFHWSTPLFSHLKGHTDISLQWMDVFSLFTTEMLQDLVDTFYLTCFSSAVHSQHFLPQFWVNAWHKQI